MKVKYGNADGEIVEVETDEVILENRATNLVISMSESGVMEDSYLIVASDTISISIDRADRIFLNVG